MATTLRLSQWEQDTVRQKAIKINKMLVQVGKQPMRDSEILHLILQFVLPNLATDGGEIVVRSPDDGEILFSLDDWT